MALLMACSRPESAPSSPVVAVARAPDAGNAPIAEGVRDAGDSPRTAEPAPAPALPLPPAPEGTDAAKARMLASICPAAYLRKGKPPYALGCRVHPPFGTEGRKPDGTFPAYEGDPLDFCGLVGTHVGAFTRPGAKQTALVFEQCKDGDVWDMGFPGSVVVVEERGDRYEVVATDAAAYAGDCRLVERADKTDLFACAYAFGAGPAGQVSNVFVLDFTASPPRQTILATAYEDGPWCMAPDAPSDASKGISTARITRVATKDVDGDGLVDLEVDVLRAHAPPSKALDAKLGAGCKKQQTGPLEAKSLVPAPTRTTLTFRNDGQTLVAKPEAAKTLARWLSEAPEGLFGMPH